MMHGSAWPILRSAADAFRPPNRISVADGAARTLNIVQPGGYTGPWSARETPYMVEPMNTLASRQHEAVCFVGPSRSGKTMALLDGWFAHVTAHDPGDMLIIQMTQDKARDYSKTRIDRAIRHSPVLTALKSSSGHDDNTHDKMFRHGMWLKIGWPSASQLASSDYRYVALTDYDRMPDDADGEGSPYVLAKKRTTTFLSRGMTMVESSPGRPITDPNWRPATPHEGPPCAGIVGIYNMGDRRRRYWPCPHCGEYFHVKPGLDLFASLPEEKDLLAIVRSADIEQLASEHAVIFCPHCGAGITHDSKNRMMHAGHWLRDGQEISRSGLKSEGGIKSSIASFWLSGIEAAYQSWKSLLVGYLHGLREYAMTGDEQTLISKINTDHAMPYLPMSMRHEAKRGDLEELAEPFERFIVPREARFVTMAVDVQGGQASRFVVQVHAHGKSHEQWLIDRFDITLSDRPGAEEGGKSRVDPARYVEDWNALTLLLDKTYRTAIEGQELRVKAIIVDTGGEGDEEDSVTWNSYSWWRSLPPDIKARAVLYKGGSAKGAPVIKLTRVGGRNGKRNDVPLLVCNPNLLKEMIFNGARRQDNGPNKLHFPTWLGASFWDEMRAEVRQPNGTYRKIRKRNEAVDLCVMNRALAMHLGVDGINWDHPPPWARPLMENSERMTRDDRREAASRAMAASTQQPARRTRGRMR